MWLTVPVSGSSKSKMKIVKKFFGGLKILRSAARPTVSE
jgi:hypothetical protein